MSSSRSRFHDLLWQLAVEYDRVQEQASGVSTVSRSVGPLELPQFLPSPTGNRARQVEADGALSVPLSLQSVEQTAGSPPEPAKGATITVPDISQAVVRNLSSGSLGSGNADSVGSDAADVLALTSSSKNHKFFVSMDGVPMRIHNRRPSGNKVERSRALRLDERWVELHLLNERLADENMQRLHRCVQLGRRFSASNEDIMVPSVSDSALLKFKRVVKPIHPLSRLRISWDFMGVLLVCFDVVMIPLILAWQIEVPYDSALAIIQLSGIGYWTLDVFLTFITARYDNGELTFDLGHIANWYVKSWLPFDISVITLDVVCQVCEGMYELGSQALDWIYAVRMLRLLRIIKLNSLGRTLEDTCAAQGKQWLILLVAVLKIFMMIASAAHILTCLWYYVGSSTRDAGHANWLDSFNMIGLSMGYQYLKTFHWVVSQFTPSTHPVLLPMNAAEEFTAIFVIMFSMALMGSMLSRMVATMNQLNAMVAERTKTQRQIQRYLTVSKVPVELSTRIQRCMEHALLTRTKVMQKPSHLSILPFKLNAELTMAQVGRNFISHPFFNLIIHTKLNVLSELWVAFKNETFDIDDIVFHADNPVRCMYFTSQGLYRLHFPPQAANVKTFRAFQDFREPQWFAEAGLYTSLKHTSTLTAMSFGEVFTLTGQDFADAMKNSPLGIVAGYEYGQAFLRRVRQHEEKSPQEAASGLDLLPARFSEEACQATELAEIVMSQVGSTWHSVRLHEPRGRISPCVAPVSDDPPQKFIRAAMDASMTDARLLAELELYFPEVHMGGGTYRHVSLMDEREHVVLGMLSAVWLLRDDYDAMVAGQSEKKRLTRETWAEMQKFVQWVDADDELILGALTFLAIRGLGKARKFSYMAPPGPDRRHPELAVAYAMRENTHLVPSVRRLTEDQFDLVRTSLVTHVEFNFAQMMQGENIPYSVRRLQENVQEAFSTPKLLKFYLFVQACMMCGLAGKRLQGSLFLTEANAVMLLKGLKCLQQVEQEDCLVTYWKYIADRAQMLQLPYRDPEDLAFARLLCLTRTTDSSNLLSVQLAWKQLGHIERKVFGEWFLRDGVNESAFIFKYLPTYLANARDNPAVGLHQALVTFLEFIERLLENGCMEQQPMNVVVDISDLATLVAQVRVPQALNKAVELAKIIRQGDKVALIMTSKSWRHATAVSTFKKNGAPSELMLNPEGNDLDPRHSCRSMSISSAGMLSPLP